LAVADVRESRGRSACFRDSCLTKEVPIGWWESKVLRPAERSVAVAVFVSKLWRISQKRCQGVYATPA
jgi:hypothetical protein